MQEQILTKLKIIKEKFNFSQTQLLTIFLIMVLSFNGYVGYSVYQQMQNILQIQQQYEDQFKQVNDEKDKLLESIYQITDTIQKLNDQIDDITKIKTNIPEIFSPMSFVNYMTMEATCYGGYESGLYTADGTYVGDSSFDAYIVASDAMAIGCLKALNENNIKVPDVVSIISYDNISLSQYTIPSLTTIDMNTKHMGETALDLLIERVNNDREIAKKVTIPTRLIKRASSL